MLHLSYISQDLETVKFSKLSKRSWRYCQEECGNKANVGSECLLSLNYTDVTLFPVIICTSLQLFSLQCDTPHPDTASCVKEYGLYLHIWFYSHLINITASIPFRWTNASSLPTMCQIMTSQHWGLWKYSMKKFLGGGGHAGQWIWLSPTNDLDCLCIDSSKPHCLDLVCFPNMGLERHHIQY